MGGWGSYKIDGHSRTSQKHRKGFSKIKELNLSNSKSSGVLLNPKIDILENRNTRLKATKLFIIILGAIVLAFCVYLGKSIALNLVSYKSNLNTKYEQSQQYSKIYYYNDLVSKGYSNYYKGRNQQAIEDFTRALKLISDGEIAMLGMTRCMINTCITENKYCNESIEYIEYLYCRGTIEFEEYEKLRG